MILSELLMMQILLTMTDYDKKKNQLIKKCKEFLESHEGCVVITRENPKVKLNYFGDDIETTVDSMYFENGYDDNDNEVLEVWVTTFAEDYPDGVSYDNLADFSNDEIISIMGLFGIVQVLFVC